jgi:hypothetical protein
MLMKCTNERHSKMEWKDIEPISALIYMELGS